MVWQASTSPGSVDSGRFSGSSLFGRPSSLLVNLPEVGRRALRPANAGGPRTGAAAATERSLWPSLRHLQVTQHPLQSLLVSVMVLPSAEVANVALDAQAACPGFVCVQHGVIDP